MLVHAPMPETLAVQRPPATYGELLDSTHHALRSAIDLPNARLPEPETVRAECHGLRRFLHTCGIHLRLLAGLQDGVTAEQLQLVRRLTNMRHTAAGPSVWLDASQPLGAAHDLLATHLDIGYRPRSAEAEDMLTSAAALTAFREVTGMVIAAAQAVPDLLQLAHESQRRADRMPITDTDRKVIREKAPILMTLGKASLFDTAGAPTSSPLDDLQPAVPVTQNNAAGREFDSPHGTLRILRQLTYAQAHGEVDASPTSVRDLALLGADLTHPDLPWLPPATTAMERLDRAQAQDIFDNAHHAWTTAAQQLPPSIAGTTRAPRQYADALEHLKQAEPGNTAVRLALLSALPRLGADAASVVDSLHSRSALVEKRREPGELRLVWRPISAENAHQLSENIRAAATATANAAVVAHRLTSPGRAPTLPSPAAPQLTRGLVAERTRIETR